MRASGGNFTKAGTIEELVQLVRLTISLRVGATPDKVAVPIGGVRPITAVGVKVIDKIVGGLIVSVEEFDFEPSVSVMTTWV
jgi:hypothetical protein